MREDEYELFLPFFPLLEVRTPRRKDGAQMKIRGEHGFYLLPILREGKGVKKVSEESGLIKKSKALSFLFYLYLPSYFGRREEEERKKERRKGE